MTKLQADDILRVLRAAPDGLTTAEAAKELGHPVQRVSTRLSKMAMYGQIDREFVRGGPSNGAHAPRWSQWMVKQDAQ